MIIRLYYKKLGGHYHCRLFTAKAKNMTFAKCGDLTVAEEEWNTFQDILHSSIDIIPEEVISDSILNSCYDGCYGKD